MEAQNSIGSCVSMCMIDYYNLLSVFGREGVNADSNVKQFV